VRQSLLSLLVRGRVALIQVVGERHRGALLMWLWVVGVQEGESRVGYFVFAPVFPFGSRSLQTEYQ
jgi:hypothetical protein